MKRKYFDVNSKTAFFAVCYIRVALWGNTNILLNACGSTCARYKGYMINYMQSTHGTGKSLFSWNYALKSGS